MPQVWPLRFAGITAAVPVSFVRINRIAGAVLLVIELRAVKNEELGFRSKVGNIGDARALQIALGAYRHNARGKAITLARERDDGVGHQAKGRLAGKMIS